MSKEIPDWKMQLAALDGELVNTLHCVDCFCEENKRARMYDVCITFDPTVIVRCPGCGGTKVSLLFPKRNKMFNFEEKKVSNI